MIKAIIVLRRFAVWYMLSLFALALIPGLRNYAGLIAIVPAYIMTKWLTKN